LCANISKLWLEPTFGVLSNKAKLSLDVLAGPEKMTLKYNGVSGL
jgi:hypothetical protein